MAMPFGKSLLALVAALVAAGHAVGQDELKDAVFQLRMGKSEEALATLRSILNENPSSEEAYDLYRSIDQDNWARLLIEEGEIGKIAESLLDRARVGRVERSRDSEAIASLVGTAVTDDDYGARQKAIATLAAEHGEFAVPSLVSRLSSDDEDEVIRAMMALDSIGRPATLPLIEALGSPDASVRANVVATLRHIDDRRAAAAVARLAQTDDQEAVRAVARDVLAKWGLEKANPGELYRENARRYLDGRNLGPGEGSDVVWHMQEGQLLAVDVPAGIYSQELAKKNAHDALELDVGDAEARMLLAQAYLAQVAIIESGARSGDEDLAGLEGRIPSLRRVALATGPGVLDAAVADARERRMVRVAIGAIEAFGDAAGAVELEGSSLIAALDDGDSRIRYAAALALSEAARGGELPAAEKVVAVLGEAVTEQAMRVVHMIGGGPAAQSQAQQASGGGTDIVRAEDAVSGMSNILNFPEADAIVINEVLPDRAPEDLILTVQDDPRMQDVKILVRAKDVEAARERFGDEVIVIDASGNLREAIDSALADKPMGPAQRRANAVAIAASGSLHDLASDKVDISAAVDALVGQLGRPPEVSVAAARAIGLGGDLDDDAALVGVIAGDGALELRIAAAEAFGDLLARTGAEVGGPQFEQLIAVLRSDADAGLVTAIATALGRGKLAPGHHLQLLDVLHTPGASPVDG